MSYRDEFKQARRETVWTFWRVLPLGVMAFVAIGSISFVLSMLSRPAQVVTRVTDPDRIIQNYEWFEETYNDALALDRQIGNAQSQVSGFIESAGERSDWSREDKTEHSRLNSIVLGLRNQREGVVAEYNAKSNLLTRNLFKGSELPYQLRVQEDTTVEVWVR